MKNSKININAFTLVEVLVSITIFSIMFISIIWIYLISSDINMKSDINRVMQENLKNVASKISEDIRKDWITWVSSSAIDNCDFVKSGMNNYKIWDKLCSKSWNIYYLAKKDVVLWEYYRVTDSSQCSNINDNCVIAMWPNLPLTNSYVSIKDLKFYLSDDAVPKVTINIVLQSSAKKWVKSNMIKESSIIFQTTISERLF